MKNLKIILPIVFLASIAFSQGYLPKINVGNVQITSNTISTTNSNGNLNLTPNGSGKVVTGANLNLSAFGGSKVLVSDSSKNLAESAVTSTTLGFLDVGSSLTTLLSGKVSTTLASANILVGNVSNVATALAPTGDVTITNAGVTAIGTNKVTNSQAAQMVAHTFKGNNTGSTANALDLTATQLTAELNNMVGDSGSGGTKGLVPAPASGDAAATKFLKADGTWTTVSASGGGGINYITNPGAETNTNGWATYADAAATTPVDGTGGSPSETWTRSTSSPLRDTGSFLLTKGASNRQGDGVSYDFTIASADQAKVLTIGFEYLVSSGTYADGDLKLFLYDVTNAILIPVSGLSILNVNGTSAYKQIATFQTNSNSTSYRFIIHTTSTSASAYTLKFDNFSLGPASMTTGPPMTDWVTFSMVITAPTINPTKIASPDFDKAMWRRVGDSMEIYWDYYAVAANAGNGGSGTYAFKIPAGYTIDTSKVTTNVNQTNHMGSGSLFAGSNNGACIVSYTDTTHLGVACIDGANTLNYVGSAYGGIDSAQIGYSFHAKIPIVGWSSNVAMSNDADARVVAAYVGCASNCATDNTTNTPFDTVIYDTHGAYSAGAYTVPVPGKYSVTFNARAASGSGTIYVVKSGSNYGYIGTVPSGAGTITGGLVVSAIAGDTISVRADTATTWSGNSPFLTAMSIFRLSGPAQVAATESVNARYHSSSTTLSSGTFADIVYTTKDYDSHNAYSSATYTIPTSGKYQVNAGILLTAATTAANQLVQIQILKNGSVYSGPNEMYYTSSSSKPIGLTITDLIPCVAGDTIKVQAASAGTTPSITASTTQNYISLSRSGN